MEHHCPDAKRESAKLLHLYAEYKLTSKENNFALRHDSSREYNTLARHTDAFVEWFPNQLSLDLYHRAVN